jgi:hypothetical protein
MRLASSNVALEIEIPKLGTAPTDVVADAARDIATVYASDRAWFCEMDWAVPLVAVREAADEAVRDWAVDVDSDWLAPSDRPRLSDSPRDALVPMLSLAERL